MRSRPVAEREIRVAAARSWISAAFEPSVVRRSLRVAGVVGSLLVAINYSDHALAGSIGRADLAKMLLTYCVPYCVATYAAVQAIRGAR